MSVNPSVWLKISSFAISPYCLSSFLTISEICSKDRTRGILCMMKWGKKGVWMENFFIADEPIMV